LSLLCEYGKRYSAIATSSLTDISYGDITMKIRVLGYFARL